MTPLSTAQRPPTCSCSPGQSGGSGCQCPHGGELVTADEISEPAAPGGGGGEGGRGGGGKGERGGGGGGGQRSDTRPGRQAAIDAAVTSPTRRIRGVLGGGVTRPRGGPWGRSWGRESGGVARSPSTWLHGLRAGRQSHREPSAPFSS